MASRKDKPADLLVLRAEAGQFLAPVDVAAKIQNMVGTAEGTLRTLSGPCPYVPAYDTGDAPSSGATADTSPLTYGPMHGIFHARLQGGGRDILLVHTGDQVWEYEGFNRAYRVLIGPSGTSPLQEADIADDDRPRFPTQFEATATGIVIVPQDGRAYFYDGSVLLPLGYDRAPGAPVGFGPSASGTTSPNKGGYAHDRDAGDPWTGATAATEMLFGHGKIGTIEGALDPDYESAGFLLHGQWQAAVQWIDRWGNLSPVSPRSNAVEVSRQRSADPTSTLFLADMMRKQLAWGNLNRGPEGTVGRILCRTKDTLHAGTQRLFEVPPDVVGSEGAFATIPDNTSELYPDNVPDAALLLEPQDVVTVPLFKLCRVAFGRLWIANTDGDPGMLRASLPGRWGTFARDDVWWPDASGAEVTGLWRTALGLLVFTETSTFLVRPSDDGQSFIVATVHPEIGCVAPSSIGTLPSGLTIWLGREGFYGWDGEAVALLSVPIARTVRQLNRGRRMAACAAVDPTAGEYRCWVASEGSRENDLCLVYDGASWRRRTDVVAAAVCVTRDHRQYMLAAGDVSTDTGVWVLDHETLQFDNPPRTSIVETAWIEAAASQTPRSARQVNLFLREEQKRPLTVEVMRDWRETVIETHDVSSTPTDEQPWLYPEADPPSFWNVTLLDATDAEWVRRRPFWRRVQVSIPSCEVFKIRLSFTPALSHEPTAQDPRAVVSPRWEFIGMTVDAVDQSSGRYPP